MSLASGGSLRCCGAASFRAASFRAASFGAALLGAALLAIPMPAALAAQVVRAGLPGGSPTAQRPAPDGSIGSALPQFSDDASRVERVLALENDRLALMPAVAAWKWQHHVSITDPARERIVIAEAARLAAPLGLDGSGIERLFALQVRLASDEEHRLQRTWQERGFDFTGPVPDLARASRPRLDRLTSELLEALYLAAPVCKRPGFAARYAAAADRRLSAPGWTPSKRRALLAALASIRTSGPVLPRIVRSGVLRIGTTGDYAPFSSEEHGVPQRGTLRGVDIELARSLARTLGVEPIFVRTSWPGLLEDLRRGAFDIAIGGIAATPARASAGMLSIPYFSGGKTIAARCADLDRFGSLAPGRLATLDRPDVRVIVNPGGTNEAFVREHLRHAAIVVDADNETLFDELAAGRGDVIITDDTEVELQVRRHPGLCRAYRGTLTRADKVILMARDPELARAVNDWLHRQLAAGVPQQLLQEALATAGTGR